MKEIGIYIHIPFCKSKCNYCDFTSFCNKDDEINRYVKALKKEIQERSDETYRVKTVFIGGGTPSYIDSKYIEEILACVESNYKMDNKVEISLEMNPGTVNEGKLKDYFESGINRISIGLQSSNDQLLKKIGRIHNYQQFEDTVKMAKKVGFTNINTDVMIGLPTQTIYDVENTVNSLISLEIPHISVYSLIVEPNTKIEKLLDEGKIQLPDEEIERYMYWYAKRKLEDGGYIHYEISNFAKYGYECKHNLDCWNQSEYLGFGIAAASYENGIRFINTDSLDEYITNIEKECGYKNIKIEEKQDKRLMMDEYMMIGLRKIQGVNISKFKEKFGVSPLTIYHKTILKLLSENLIEINLDNIILSKKGLDLANIVWEEFV